MKLISPPLLLAALLGGALPAVRGATAPAYRFQAGSNYTYSVTITADEPKHVETVTGTATYAVKQAGADGATIEVRRDLKSSRKSKSGHYIPMSAFMSGGFRAGPFRLAEWGGPRGLIERPREMKIDAHGYLLEETGDTALPQALGDLSRLLIWPLSDAGKDRWESESRCNIILEEKEFTSPGSRLYRIKEVKLAAVEKTTYQLVKKDGDELAIQKTYELKTRQTVNGEPRMVLTGEGTLTLNPKAGVATALKFEAKLVENSDNVTVRTPISVEARLMSRQELADLAKKRAETERIAKEGAVMTGEKMAGLIKDLKSSDKNKQRVAAGQLTGAKPDEHQGEIAQLLVAALGNEDKFFRQMIANALGRWADKESVPKLLEVLSADEHFPVRWDILKAFSRLKDSRTVAPLAERLVANQDRQQVTAALKEMGPLAEDAVLKLVGHESAEVRREACQILKEVGTAKSVPALEQAQKDSDNLVKMFAGLAIKEAAKRK